MVSTPLRIVLAATLLAAALPAAPAWKILKRDNQAMLSIDTQSIVKNGDEVSLRYLIDYRQPQGNITEGQQYRSTITSAKLRCKAKTISIGHTDAFFAWGGAGNIVAKTAPPKGDAVFHPLEKGSSDQELWTHICETRLSLPPVAPKK